MAKKKVKSRVNRLTLIRKSSIVEKLAAIGSITASVFKIAIFVVLIFWVISFILPAAEIINGNVAVIPIKGMITTGAAPSFFVEFTSSGQVVDWIKKADKNDKVKAIIFEINSPGGSPVATDEIVQAAKAVNKPIYAIIREMGASGGYWIASTADVIIANRMSMTGSIGVVASYLEYSGLLDDYNVTYQRLVSGEYKDMGSKYKEMTESEKALMQKKIDLIYEIFVEDVALNRNMSVSEMRKIATGSIYLGIEAKQLGLVDVLGTKDDAIKLIEEDLGIEAKLYVFRKPAGLFSGAAETMNEGFYSIGQGIGSVFTSKADAREVSVWT